MGVRGPRIQIDGAGRRLLEVGADQVDEVLGEFGGDVLPGAGGEVLADVSLHNLAHEAVDAAADGGEEHELAVAVFTGGEEAFEGVELAAEPAEALEELGSFPFGEVAGGGGGRILYTHWGYGIRALKAVSREISAGEFRAKSEFACPFRH